jgi:hypothetical protein
LRILKKIVVFVLYLANHQVTGKQKIRFGAMQPTAITIAFGIVYMRPESVA